MDSKLRLKLLYESQLEYGWNVYGDINSPLDKDITEWQFDYTPIWYEPYFDFDQSKMKMYDSETAKERDIVRGKWECVSCGKIGELKGFFKARYENDHYCMDCVEIVGEE